MGLTEVSPDRWVDKDGMKELVVFDGGLMMTTRIMLDRPEFDIVSIHRGERPDLLACLKAHVEEIKRRTAEIENNTKKAMKDRTPS